MLILYVNTFAYVTLKIFSSDLIPVNTRESVIWFGQIKSPKQQNACIYTSDTQQIGVCLIFRFIFEFSLGYW